MRRIGNLQIKSHYKYSRRNTIYHIIILTLYYPSSYRFNILLRVFCMISALRSLFGILLKRLLKVWGGEAYERRTGFSLQHKWKSFSSEQRMVAKGEVLFCFLPKQFCLQQFLFTSSDIKQIILRPCLFYSLTAILKNNTFFFFSSPLPAPRSE